MAFKDDIESMCAKAIRDNTDIIVRLPPAPLHYDQHMKDERFFQLLNLIKLNGCTLSKVNLTDYRIHAAKE
jgi:hypothetical protein